MKLFRLMMFALSFRSKEAAYENKNTLLMRAYMLAMRSRLTFRVRGKLGLEHSREAASAASVRPGVAEVHVAVVLA